MEEKFDGKFFLDRARCNNLQLAQKMKDIAYPHIESFNYVYNEGLQKIC